MEKSKMNKTTFGMSETGKCPRALSAQLLGMEAEAKPKWLDMAAEEGHWHEERIIRKLETGQIDIPGYGIHNWIVEARQKEYSREFPSFNLLGHIEGITYFAQINDNPMLLEIKSMSQFEFDRWMKGGFEAFPNYADQVTCYMEATGLEECLYIVKNRSSGYEDKRVLTGKPSHMTVIIGHLTEVVSRTLVNELVPKEFDPQSIECRRCEYKKLCIPEPKELTSVEKTELAISADNWRKGKALIGEGQLLVDLAKNVFEQHTRATNIFKWSFNKLAIQLVHYSESLTYPKSKLLQTFTEEQLKPASQVKEAFDQLRITDLEKDLEDKPKRYP